MVFPIMPNQRGNFQPRGNDVINNRFASRTNRTTNTNGIQRIFEKLSNPDSSIGSMATRGLNDISKTLSNVDQVIKVVQSATPIVQEYGPMVKNLPAMYRMVKAFNQIEEDSKEKSIVQNKELLKDTLADNEISEQREINTVGESTPRIYI